MLEEISQHFSIPWGNVVGFSSDTANVMVGKNNSVLSRLHEATHGKVYDLGCVSHLANLCANNLVKTLPVPVEDIIVDTFYFLWQFEAERRVQRISAVYWSGYTGSFSACLYLLVVA